MNADAKIERPEEVSLAQYAAVLVGVSLGGTLEQVLDNERLDPACWRIAERAWAARLAHSSGDSLRIAFDQAMGEARTRYRRPWQPLDESLEYWIAFSRHLDADPNPLAMLANLGMKPSELLALRKLWEQRLSADGELATRAQALLAIDELGALPRISPGPLEMAPPVRRDDTPRLGRLDERASTPPAFPLHPPKRVSKTAMEQTHQEGEPPPRPGPTPAELARTAYDGDLRAVLAGVETQSSGAEPQEPPFRSAPLSIRQYAAVRVQTDLEPARAATVLEEYGLTLAAKQALDQELRAACANDPKTAKAWEEAYAAYLEWWTKSRSEQG